MRKDRVNELHAGVKKLSRLPYSVNIARLLLCRPACAGVTGMEIEMSVVLYIVLTVAIFALLGLVQKLVEGL
jgi:membrane protein YdbS with pleckstrin-like domain